MVARGGASTGSSTAVLHTVALVHTRALRGYGCTTPCRFWPVYESASDVEWGVDADNDVDEDSDDGYGLDDPLAEAGEGGGY